MEELNEGKDVGIMGGEAWVSTAVGERTMITEAVDEICREDDGWLHIC